MNRRQAMISLGLGAAGLLVPPWPRRALAGPAACLPGDLDAAAALFRETPRDRILEAGAAAAAKGDGIRTILGGAFLAGVREVRPRHVGGKLHCVMMVESAFQMCRELPEADAHLLALWALDDFKRSQARDARDGDWSLPEAPRAAPASEKAARAELRAAMEAWDDGRADAALVGLLPFHDRASLFEILWPFAARSFVNIGHKIIYAAQIDRTLGRLPWSHARPALRSLVHGLLHADAGGRGLEAWERSREMAPALPGGWMEGGESPEGSLAIMRKLRERDSAGAQRLVVEAFKDRVGPATVWDGLRLAASEIFLRRPAAPPADRRSLLPVHAVTVTEAFGHAFRSTRSDATRRLLVLQAAGWLPDLREALFRLQSLRKEGPELDKLAGEKASPEKDTGRAVRRALASGRPGAVRTMLEAATERAGPYRDALRRGLARAGVEHHQHKYAAAFLAESRRVHPRWAPLILAPAPGYLPPPGSAETELTGRARAALRKAGLAG